MAVELSLLLLLSFLWGASYTLIKVAVDTIPPLTIVATRVSLAAAVLCVVAYHRGLSLPKSARTWRPLVMQACLLNVIPFTLIAWGERHISSGMTGILNSTPPLFIFLITLLWVRREPAAGQKLAGVVLGTSGVALIVGVDALAGIGKHTVAQLAVITASACYALAAINGRALAPLSPFVIAAATMLCAATLMVPASIMVDKPWTLTPSVPSLAALGTLALVSTAVGTIIYYRLLTTLGPIGTASNSYLRAGVSVVLGLLFLGEGVNWASGLGLALVVAGVAAINGQLAWPWRALTRTRIPSASNV